MKFLVIFCVLATPAAWAAAVMPSLSSSDYVCVNSTAGVPSGECSPIDQFQLGTTTALLSGTYAAAGDQVTSDLLTNTSYGILHAYNSESFTASGTAAYLTSNAESAFTDGLTISNPALTGQTGYLVLTYSLDGTVSSSGTASGSTTGIYVLAQVGSEPYSSVYYSSSVDGAFSFPETFPFTYGQEFQLYMYVDASVDTRPSLVPITGSAGGRRCQ